MLAAKNRNLGRIVDGKLDAGFSAAKSESIPVQDEKRASRPRRTSRAPVIYADESFHNDELQSGSRRSSTTSHHQYDNRVPMIVVDHLSKLSINPETNLPTKTFTCHRSDAGMS